MKDQFVIACIEDDASAATVLPWAHLFVRHLRHKGLMALHVSQHKKDDGWLKTLGIPYISMQGDWATAIEGIPTALNGILVVTAVNTHAPRTSLTHPKNLLHEFKNCKTAFLCVNADKSAPSPKDDRFDLSTAILTLTHRHEGKEKLIWASYLARFLDSHIIIAHPDYRDKDLRTRWHNNMRFADKVFTPLDLTYTTNIVSSSTQPDIAVLDELHPNLLIARTSDIRDRDLIDWFLPRPELRLLTHPTHTPLLLLNPRDDLYILCD